MSGANILLQFASVARSRFNVTGDRTTSHIQYGPRRSLLPRCCSTRRLQSGKTSISNQDIEQVSTDTMDTNQGDKISRNSTVIDSGKKGKSVAKVASGTKKKMKVTQRRKR